MGTESASPPPAAGGGDLQELAKRHLWMHFTRMGSYAEHEVPVIVRGEGCYVYDQHGKRYLDGLSALYCVNIGHGRAELGEAAARQAKELGFYTNWSYAHPRSIELAARIAASLPGTSTASSSPPAARRRWRARGSSRRPTTPPAASPAGTRSSPATSPTTAPRWAP